MRTQRTRHHIRVFRIHDTPILKNGLSLSTDLPLSAQRRLEFSSKVPVFVPVHFQAGLLDGPTTVCNTRRIAYR